MAAPAPWPLLVYLGDVWGTSADWLNCFNIIYKMDSKIGFEMSLVAVEAIRGRCASCMVLTVTVSDMFGGQTNSSILVGLVGPIDIALTLCNMFVRIVIPGRFDSRAPSHSELALYRASLNIAYNDLEITT